jgi:ribosomal protein L3 glutamine methyltransferase
LPRYDLIICNPPYEPDALLETLPPEFRREPANALVSDADGLGVIRKLLPQAAARLTPTGILLVEVGALHDAIEAQWPDLETNWLPVADETDCIALFQAAALKKVFG